MADIAARHGAQQTKNLRLAVTTSFLKRDIINRLKALLWNYTGRYE
jgi:hypothetical protein